MGVSKGSRFRFQNGFNNLPVYFIVYSSVGRALLFPLLELAVILGDNVVRCRKNGDEDGDGDLQRQLHGAPVVASEAVVVFGSELLSFLKGTARGTITITHSPFEVSYGGSGASRAKRKSCYAGGNTTMMGDVLNAV